LRAPVDAFFQDVTVNAPDPKLRENRLALLNALRALSTLRAPVDAFFQDVTVNAPDPKLRENRLALLNALRAATREVAEFAKIEG
ncbi:hypothetical protein CTI14_29860, partial [Methylobacterium radiotolerans]